MARRPDIKKKAFIPIPKDMNKASWKIIIINSGTEYDVTDYLLSGTITRIATVGVSNFSLEVDNGNGRYKDKFSAGDSVDVYYDYLEESQISTVRFRGYIDGVYDNVDSNGYSLLIEGRDAPKSSSNEHFADTHITLSFVSRNNLDCWFGTTGSTDGEGNYSDGVLYNSGLILRVYDTADSTWKNYKDLTDEQKTTLKAQTGYTQTHINTYVEKSRLTISQELASEGDYDFRIYYDGTYSYLMVHPENAILNSNEHVTIGQNFISLNRYGKDTTEEFNRIKQKGFTDGIIILMRTKEDTARQSAVWIKDKEETTTALKDDDEIVGKANARLNELKEALSKGTITCCGLPSLQPAEKVPVNIPYVMNENLKVKSFTVNFGADLDFNLNIQDRETTFEKIFKDQMDDTVDITPTDNPNGMMNAFVYDFSNEFGYTLVDCQITNNTLSLSSGKSTGTCTTTIETVDNNITKCEIRIKANQMWNCTYRVSNDGGLTFEDMSLIAVHTFISVGSSLVLEITLNESTSGVSPEFDKVNILVYP